MNCLFYRMEGPELGMFSSDWMNQITYDGLFFHDQHFFECSLCACACEESESNNFIREVIWCSGGGAAASDPHSVKWVVVLSKEITDTKPPKQYFDAGTQHVIPPATISYITMSQKPERCRVFCKYESHLPWKITYVVQQLHFGDSQSSLMHQRLW